MNGEITIINRSRKWTEIDIEGVIGVPESEQFTDSESKVATYQKFKSAIQQIREVKSPRVTVNIRSLGGSVNDALLIHDTLAELEAEITTKCFGYVASAATIIAQAASKGRRLISENALYLVHKATSQTEGNAAEISQTLQLLDKTDQRIAAIYAARSGKSVATFVQLMNANNGAGKWLSAGETVSYGLADRIIEPAVIANNMTQIIKKLNLPALPMKTATPAAEVPVTPVSASLSLASSTSDCCTVSTPLANAVQKTRKRGWRALVERLLPSGIFSAKTINPQIQHGVIVSNAAETTLQDDSLRPVDELKEQIRCLRAQNAKLSAHPTLTLPKEDPTAHGEMKTIGNRRAYEADFRRLLEQ